MSFQKTPDWLDWCAQPSPPRFVVPPGSVDAHCHVFGPGAVFPFAPERKYTPCDASRQQLYELRDHLGFERNVVVQATCHGTDNRAMVDALKHSGGKARGIATVKRTVTDHELHGMHALGVRGVRFNFVRRLVDFTPRDELMEIAARIAPLGWHVVIYFEAVDLPELRDFFTALPTTVVVDHMGRPDVSKPVDGPEFEGFVRLMREHENIWSKVSCPERLSITGPKALHAAGVRGARFNFVRRLVDFTPRDELMAIARRIAPLGWHVVVYFEAADLPELIDFFTTLPTPVVVDHMGRPDVTRPVDGPEFARFVALMREHPNVWSKVSCPERLSVSGPPARDGERHPYRDVVPFARRLIDEFPDRVLWGTDWPHPNLKDHMPDDGLLVDFIPDIAPTRELQHKLLVDNPMRLYWPEETR